MNERLYRLLPETYRTHDDEQGEPLRALMQVLESEFDVISKDIAGLYANWFIETCDEWVVDYIADLLGVKGIREDRNVSMRAFIARTIAYRRRKGTPQVLEEVARDLLNRPTRVQEFQFLLAQTQHLNHLRLERKATMDVRSPDACRWTHTAFDKSMHLAETGLIPSLRGCHNIPNVGVSVWRIQSYQVVKGAAGKIASGRFTFDPFGRDRPIYNLERTQIDPYAPTLESDVPAPLEPRPLASETNGLRSEEVDTDGVYFGKQPVFELFLDGGEHSVDPKNIYIADLSTWRNPKSARKVAVDPVLGRIATKKSSVESVEVTYCYGSPGDTGGGSYTQERFKAVGESKDRIEFTIGPGGLSSFEEVFLHWKPETRKNLTIVVDSNETMTLDGGLELSGDGTTITIEAAEGKTPCIVGNITTDSSKQPSAIRVGGLWIQGQIIAGSKLESLILRDLTFIGHGQPSLVATNDSPRLSIAVQNCKLGACHLHPRVDRVSFLNTIIGTLTDGDFGPPLQDGFSISKEDGKAGPSIELERCTVFGKLNAKQVDISESIMLGLVTAERTQVGCVRYSWLPLGSSAPRRFYCQPNLELTAQEIDNPDADLAALRDLATRLTYPRFESLKPVDASYAQLARGCPLQVSEGAEDGGEMGAWYTLYEQERVANFNAALDEYLRFGLDAGLISRT